MSSIFMWRFHLTAAAAIGLVYIPSASAQVQPLNAQQLIGQGIYRKGDPIRLCTVQDIDVSANGKIRFYNCSGDLYGKLHASFSEDTIVIKIGNNGVDRLETTASTAVLNNFARIARELKSRQ